MREKTTASPIRTTIGEELQSFGWINYWGAVTADDLSEAIDRCDDRLRQGTCAPRLANFRAAIVAYLAGDHDVARRELNAWGRPNHPWIDGAFGT